MYEILESCARRMMIATVAMVEYKAPTKRKKKNKKKAADVAINNVVIAPKAITPDAGASTSETEVTEDV